MDSSFVNPLLFLVTVACLVFAGVLLIDPKTARWLAHVLLARARAVEEARRIYTIVRRCDILLAAEEEHSVK